MHEAIYDLLPEEQTQVNVIFELHLTACLQMHMVLGTRENLSGERGILFWVLVKPTRYKGLAAVTHTAWADKRKYKEYKEVFQCVGRVMRYRKRMDFKILSCFLMSRDGSPGISAEMLCKWQHFGLECSPLRGLFYNTAQNQWLPKVPKCITHPNCTRCAFAGVCCSHCYCRVVNLKDRKDRFSHWIQVVISLSHWIKWSLLAQEGDLLPSRLGTSC